MLSRSPFDMFVVVASPLIFATLAGCSSLSSLNPFGPDRPKPKDLEPIAAPITVREAWRQSVGKVEFPLTIAVNGTTLTIAASDGTVLAVDAESGRTVWRTSVGTTISAGVGSDGKVAAVVTRDGNLVALEGAKVRRVVDRGQWLLYENLVPTPPRNLEELPPS